MAYRLVTKNVASEFKVGHVFYLHHVKGLSAKEIKKNFVDFGSQSGIESKEAYEIAILYD